MQPPYKMNNIANRVSQIQGWIEKQSLNALIISHADEYLSEYVPPENERLAWATGFTGSAGLAIITSEKRAVFVDGRYTVQVKEQVDSNLYETLHIKDSPWTKWIEQNLQSNAKIGYDPRLHQANWEENTKKLLEDNFNLVPIDENPIDLFWKERPQPNENKALLLNEKYTGKSSGDKRRNMAEEISKNNCDAAFLTQLDSIAWLLNIRGNDVPCNPVLLCHGLLHADGSFELFIDKNKIPDDFHNHVGQNVAFYAPTDIKKQLQNFAGKKIQLDSKRSNIWAKNIISDAGATVILKDDPCTLPKACKNDTEIQGMKNCHIRDATAVCNFLAWLDDKIDEGNLPNEAALSDKIDSLRAELDLFKGISFGTISAAGENAALPHYSHRGKTTPVSLTMDSVYLVDSGGQYLDGTTDITRTVAVGMPSDVIKKASTLVLKGHISLSSARFPEGIAGQSLDTFARQHLWQEGLDYDHGTGHGVGCYLNVHEGPHSIGKGANKVPLKEGMVVSNEPGYYKEGEFGIRSENLIFVKKIKDADCKNLLGFENLTYVPFDTRLLDMSLLIESEIAWINQYHSEVLNKVGPHLEGSALEWLKKAVQAV